MDKPAFQRDYIFDAKGYKVLDFVGRQESMEEYFRIICDKIGIQAKLPRYNVSTDEAYRKH